MYRILVEDDPYLRIAPVILDPHSSEEHRRAIADFMAHDVSDFIQWCENLRSKIPGLYPAKVELVSSQDGLRAALPDADAAIVETLQIGEPELLRAPKLAIVQKFGSILSNINVSACVKRGIVVESRRRRVNVAVAEHAFTLMIALAKRLCETAGLVDERALRAAGFDPTPYDRRYTTNSNFARIGRLKTLNGAIFGALGMGEIGRELARRAMCFGMTVIYHQRHRMSELDEQALGAQFAGFQELLERSDFIALNVPLNAWTRAMLGREALAAVKSGVIIVNTSRAALVDEKALLDALNSGRIGGYGLDVGYQEPAEPDEPLLKYRNVILTPHTAVAGRENGLEDMADIFVKLWRALVPNPA
jgi:phosphoglycerate dehydrogenase-like enzyme